jgi:hypothetical protein
MIRRACSVADKETQQKEAKITKALREGLCVTVERDLPPSQMLWRASRARWHKNPACRQITSAFGEQLSSSSEKTIHLRFLRCLL